MEKSLLEQLMTLPADVTTATIQGVAMQIIDDATRQSLLQSDPEDTHIHECTLSNGTFIADMQNGRLVALYKVR
ncbi:hypothetical protein [uncultured Alistipes sp.]|jgi:hypothetical protein|uniref:hypothetical protein n=1 Tax=Alistipes TaxID=239759 RepID=UPI00266C9BB2|nr:hypothetical protein [uncultured Alistipes sp.]